MLHIVRSNRLEALVEALARTLDRDPIADPMRQEVVAVPSRGMERWLAQRLSQRVGAQYGNGGVCAHVDFPFPAKVVRRVLLEASGDAAGAVASDPWAPDTMTWAVLTALAQRLDEPAFAPLARYLGRDAAGLRAGVDARAHALARRIARVFDRYDLHRPALVRAFLDPEARPGIADFGLRDSEAWQAPLWQALLEQLGQPSLASRLHAGVDALRARAPQSYARISVFGVASLPAAQLAALDALALHIPVHLYLLAPSEAYWADIRSRREQLRNLGGPAALIAPEALARTEGHPLLASLGVVARDFQVVLERSVEHYVDSPVFIDPAPGEFDEPTPSDELPPPRLLQWLQSDMLHLRNRGAGTPDAEGFSTHAQRMRIEVDDDSVELHACHGDMRQVEVLRDRLLELFAEDPSLQPRDVLVMSPDIERFAALIPAVFDEGAARRDDGPEPWGRAGTPKLPFHVADRSLAATNPMAAAFLELLGLAEARLDAAQVLDFLGHAVVRERFDIAAEELETLRAWVHAAGARWGVDAEHRAAFDQPAQHTYTWAFALSRLALGVAMADEGEDFGGHLPFDDVEGSSVELLGRFSSYCEALFDACERLRSTRSLSAWREVLLASLDALFAPGRGQSWWMLGLRAEIDALMEDAADFEIEVDREVVLERLGERLSRGLGAVGHQTGAITFCAMAPMRSVPHRVVVLLGMSDGAFPRSEGGLDFDAMVRRPHLGDPNPRNEDRFLLLEAILAARERLLITYEGRDARRNERRPPAVPIAELIDHLERAFERADGARVLAAIEHPLSRDDPRYFHPRSGTPPSAGAKGQAHPSPTDRLPRRYDREALEVARASQTREIRPWTPPAPPQSEAREGPIEAGEVVEVERLRRELDKAARTYLHHQLGARLPRGEDELPVREGLELGTLDDYGLRAELMQARWVAATSGRAVESIEVLTARLRARGQLPPGLPGRVALEAAHDEVAETFEQLGIQDPKSASVRALDLEVGPFGPRELRLRARLHTDAEGRGIFATPSKAHGASCLSAWLHYLCLQASEAAGADAVGLRAAFSDGWLDLGGLTPAEARARLDELVHLWTRAREAPIPFLSKTAWAFIEASDDTSADATASFEAMNKAAKTFEGSDWSPGEGDAPEFTVVWGEVPDFESFASHTDFLHVASSTFAPLRASILASGGSLARKIKARGGASTRGKGARG